MANPSDPAAPGSACACGRPRAWPWLFCGDNRCDFTPDLLRIRAAAAARRERRRA